MKSLTEKQLREMLQVAYEQGREDTWLIENKKEKVETVVERKNKLFDELIGEV